LKESITKGRIEAAVKNNLAWFMNSGIMDPCDGTWGVGERVLLTKGNSAVEIAYKSFSSYTPFDGYSILEHRRPDCNFETAVLFLAAGIYFGEEEYTNIGRNILRYLFRRSGTWRVDEKDPARWLWRWANPQWSGICWVDDNSWNCTMALAAARLDPVIDKELGLRAAGLRTGESLLALAQDVLDGASNYDVNVTGGRNMAPHFMGLAAMAMAFIYKETGNEACRQAVRKYMECISKEQSTSNHAYLVMAFSVCATLFDDAEMADIARASADYLISRMGAKGDIPSEHSEAPEGTELVDTIYTQNWALLGFQSLWMLTGLPQYKSALDKTIELIASIQDTSPQKHLFGCWRGMFDIKTNSWGGGDRYEGGANSIYSGWTNAPISLALLFELNGKSLQHLML